MKEKQMKKSDVRQLPEQEQRVETGVVQFGDDWPGVFIRGDNAFNFAIHLKIMIDRVDDTDPINKMTVESLLDLLGASNMHTMEDA
jgi:hypothetical protein